MANAIAAVAENRMTMYAAVKQYKIPKTTLARHFQHRDKVLKVGRPTVLSASEEARDS